MPAQRPGGGGSSSVTASQITDAGTTGIALVQASTAAAARTALSAGSSTAGLLSALPGSASEGDSFYATDIKQVFFWRSGAWCYPSGAPYLTLAAATGATPVLDLRSDLGVTLVSSAVSAWASQGSISTSAAQGTAGYRPSYVAGKTPNGRPGILFNGVDRFLDVPYAAGLNPSAMTLAVVADVYGSGAQVLLAPPYQDGSHTSPYYVWTLYASSGTTVGLRVGSSASNSTPSRPSGKYLWSQPQTYVYTLNGSARVLRAGGVEAVSASGATPSNTNTTPLRIGANGLGGGSSPSNEPLLGHIHRVVMFDSVLSASAIAALEEQLALWSGIPLSW